MPQYLGKRKRACSAAPSKRARRDNVDWKVKRRARPARYNLVRAPVNKVCYFEAECVSRVFTMTPTQNQLNGDNYIILNRYDYSAIYSVGNSIGVDSSPRFVSLRSQFREFAITGVKVELTPNDRENVAVNG